MSYKKCFEAQLVMASIFGALAVAVIAYQLHHRHEVRTKIYRSLYAELTGMERSISDVSINPNSVAGLEAIERDSDFRYLPKDLQAQVQALTRDATRYQNWISLFSNNTQQEVHGSIKNLRTQPIDDAWIEQTVAILQQAQRAGDGPLRSHSFERSGRTVAWNLSRRDHPTISMPGGPIWGLDDWLKYPDSTVQIESAWSDLDFLYFDDMRDESGFRITRSDLERNRITLKEFADPIYASLAQMPEFQSIRIERPRLLDSIMVLKAQIRTRIQQPKELSYQDES